MIISSVTTKKSSGKTIQKIARTREEREAAFGLIYQCYLHAGLCQPNGFGLRISPYQLSAGSEMFITVLDGEVVATVSLLIDSDMGLPMESLYPEQVNDMRQNGLNMGEISCLADRRVDYRRIISNLCELTRLMSQYARFHGLDGLLSITHPKHARFYKRYMAFNSIGPIKPCRQVQNKLAEPIRFCFDDIGSLSDECYQRIFGQPIPEENFTPSLISLADREYFEAKLRAIEQPNNTGEPIFRMQTSSQPQSGAFQIQTP